MIGGPFLLCPSIPLLASLFVIFLAQKHLYEKLTSDRLSFTCSKQQATSERGSVSNGQGSSDSGSVSNEQASSDSGSVSNEQASSDSGSVSNDQTSSDAGSVSNVTRRCVQTLGQ